MHSIASRFKVGVERYLPDAFVFAILLTIVAYLMGVFLTDAGPFQMIEYWYNGFWGFLAFAMQMVVILVAGYCLAIAPIVQRGIKRLAKIPNNPGNAVMSTVLVSGAASFINWGFGLILGPIFARELAKNIKDIDYRVLIAAAFCGAMAMLPASISLTAPLLVNTPGHFLEDSIGLIPLSQTIFSTQMLFPALVSVIIFAFLFKKMHPSKDETVAFEEKFPANQSNQTEEETAATAEVQAETIAEKMDRSKLLNYIIVIGGLSWVIYYFATKGFDLNLDFTNFMLIMVGMALHGSPKNYFNAVKKAITATAGIVIQFPFYAGIMGMMASSGLIVLIANWFVSFSTEVTLPLFAFIAACIVNIFVPSAGGQWAVQGPIMIEAAKSLNVDPAVMVNAVAIGDVTTNMFQPFWALPALGIAGLGIRDIWGYCLVAMIIYFIIASISMILFI
ncbi:short-chain fatty acids transporter [Caldalkalibacillus uzonensis]|uniref:Short-chain fatty acids transporter n=1 Tax=Caldalkalibacillus uzonensis TaxID=353224 RepID=A0ABU0CY93_9BACI|nr:TIGR00366 family protein [Caldalkalibacillus uzonensis]MDQ0341113.1 short-chain fatty acids transporter [Caldalkalibacillus uzonensis]